MNTKNKIKRKTILLIGLMTQNVISFSQSLLSDINPVYNYQQVSHFANNSIQPLEVIREPNKTTLAWNIPNPYSNGVIAFCDKENKIITTRGLSGKQTGKIELCGNTEQFRFYSYKLIVDGWVIGVDNNLLKPAEKEPGEVTEALSSK
jgi:hypothetical protein